MSGEEEQRGRGGDFGRARAHVVSRHFLQKLTGLKVRVWQAGYTFRGERWTRRFSIRCCWRLGEMVYQRCERDLRWSNSHINETEWIVAGYSGAG